MQATRAHRLSMEASSDASYCERETWDDWGSRSSLSQVEEVATQSSGVEDIASLRAERDALARALAAERTRAAAAARAHDARLAELHGVIAELVRRRAHDKHARAIPEEEVSDECESTTQPAGELDNDADHSRTEQNDTSSVLSPELPTPQESKVETTIPPSTFEELPTDTENSVQDIRVDGPRVEVTTPSLCEQCDTSLNLSEKDSDVCLTTARCCEVGATSSGAGGSCERERGSPDSHQLCTPCTGRCSSREAKLASRVRLRKTEHSDTNTQPRSDEWWCGRLSEPLSLQLCAHADLREDMLTDKLHAPPCAPRIARLRAERAVLRCALARAADTAHRLYCACAVQESTVVSVCSALKAADRALETYDVLLALQETYNTDNKEERESTELVACQLLARLDQERGTPTLGEPLLSAGPWQSGAGLAAGVWCPQYEQRLRAHAALLKADTVALRATANPPKMFSYHDIDQSELCALGRGCSAAEMEAAVALQDALSDLTHKSSSSSRRRRARPPHWLDAADETDL